MLIYLLAVMFSVRPIHLYYAYMILEITLYTREVVIVSLWTFVKHENDRFETAYKIWIKTNISYILSYNLIG